ncbi:kunitz-type serine protease inhibitor taicotoxin-like [Ixodes scapularis]|uniref:kunitz-type serine protease inhibitor taicotoxin-like n=1 Tax=Ixodes scapularis TaxID=6945 RepID=UPI001A9F41F1|nr:kunitz-type serine protease inhibitor taicotoxin-like [Ixodes scapularis]
MQFIFVVTLVTLACRVVNAKTTKGTEYVCALYPDDGPCRARVPQFYFNLTTKTCEWFIYGGCEGNANDFADEDECLKKCKGRKVPSICSVPYEDEKCRYTDDKPKKRYCYNGASNECILVDPNRCPKTQNIFWNKKDCQSRCKTKEKRTFKVLKSKRWD